jgi:SAM-dependent methyltransferase
MMSGEPPPEEVFDFYRGLEAGGSDYVGYSEPSLKRVVLRTVASLPGTRVVDVGCGPNPVTDFELIRRGREVVGVELSEDFARTALLNAERQGVEMSVVCAPAHDIPLPDASFDVAVLTEVLEHVPSEYEEATLREVRRLLRPGGRLVVTVPNVHGLHWRYMQWRAGVEEQEDHLRQYTYPGLAGLLTRVGFDIDRKLRVPATTEPPWRARSAWLIDRVTVRPEHGIKVSFVAKRA